MTGKVFNKDSNKEKTGWEKYLGILFALSAAVLYSLSALIIKILMMNSLNFGAWRFLVSMILSVPFLCHAVFWKKQKVFKVISWKDSTPTIHLMMQAIVGSNSIILLFYSMEKLNFADALVISTSTPVFVCILAFLFLGEKFGILPVITALLTLFGVGIISRPPMITGAAAYDRDMLIGVSYSLGSMIGLATLYIILRFIRTVHHALINFIFSMVGFVECTFLACYMDVMCVPTIGDFLLIFGSGFFGFFAQTSLTLALKYEEAGPVSLVRTTEIVFAFVWQFIFLGVSPDLYSLVGSILVATSVILTAFRKMIANLPDGHKQKKFFSFLLY